MNLKLHIIDDQIVLDRDPGVQEDLEVRGDLEVREGRGSYIVNTGIT